MASTPSNTSSHPKLTSIQYDAKTVKRAQRALSCSPFQLQLFVDMCDRSVLLPTIAERTGVQKAYTLRPLAEGKVERHLMWLISVGLLRREVDGQGITDGFRLTPLGRQILVEAEKKGSLPIASWWDRICDICLRWFKLSI